MWKANYLSKVRIILQLNLVVDIGSCHREAVCAWDVKLKLCFARGARAQIIIITLLLSCRRIGGSGFVGCGFLLGIEGR